MAASRLVIPRLGPAPAPPRRARPLFPALTAVVAFAFLFAPWPLAHKAHLALHGLCAQRPSHSFALGGQLLPFDARMTGIYGGFLVALLYLVARGRFWASAVPPARVLVALGAAVAAMGVDGTNSLLLDLGQWHLYAPDNRLRLATGLLTGVALAVMLAFMLANSLWRRGRPDQPVVVGLGELVVLAGLTAPFGIAVVFGPAWLFAPLALLLIAAAVAVVTGLCLVILVLARGTDATYPGPGDLHRVASLALVLALLVMGGIAAARVLLEHWLGPSSLV
jgi:uncharacterized membrane protein